MNFRVLVLVTVACMIAVAIAVSLLAKPVQASMIICNPQPTPELIRWNKSRINRT